MNRKLILVCKFHILAVALEACSVGNMMKSQSDVLEESKVAGDYPKHLVKTVPGTLNAKFIFVFCLLINVDFENWFFHLLKNLVLSVMKLRVKMQDCQCIL